MTNFATMPAKPAHRQLGRRPLSIARSLAIACGAALMVATPAGAESLRWPQQAKEPVTPIVFQRAPSVTAYLLPIADRRAARCPAGHSCVVCLAGCDTTRPALVQTMVPRATAANKSTVVAAEPGDNDTDGVADDAPRFAREEWAGIVCGAEGGCRGAGIPPPRPSEVNIAVHRYQH